MHLSKIVICRFSSCAIFVDFRAQKKPPETPGAFYQKEAVVV
jgi:hypothetical protein